MSFSDLVSTLRDTGTCMPAKFANTESKNPKTGDINTMQSLVVDADWIKNVAACISILVDEEEIEPTPYANSHDGQVGPSHVSVSYYYQTKDAKAVELLEKPVIGTGITFSSVALVLHESLKAAHQAGRIALVLDESFEDLQVIYDSDAKFIPGAAGSNFMINLIPSRPEQERLSSMTKALTGAECLTTSPAAGCKPILYHCTISAGKINIE